MSRFLYRLGAACARRPARVIGLWLLLATIVVGLNATSGGTPTNSFTVPGVESQEATDALQERFPEFAGASGRVVFHVDDGRIDDPDSRSAVEGAVDRLADRADVALVGNPFDPGMPTVSEDGRTAFATVRYDVQTLQAHHYDDVVEAVEPTRDAGVQAEVSGEIANAAAEVHGGEAIGLMVAAVVLLVAFGSIVAMGIPIGTALLGVGVGMAGLGLLAALTDVPTTAPGLAMMVGLGVGIDYALFVVTRFRQHLHEGTGVAESAGIANATAGQSVLFAGTTVVIAIVGLLVAGMPAITTMGLAVALSVLVSMAVAVTLLPALLGWAGHRIDRWAIHRRRSGEAHETVSGRWAHHVGRRPGRYALLSLVGLLVVAAPVLALRVGFADDGNAAAGTTQRTAYDLTTEAYGPGFNGPLLVVVEAAGQEGTDGTDGAAGPVDDAAVAQVGAALAADPGVAVVTPAVASPDGSTSVLTVVPTTSPQDEATADLLDRARGEVLPAALDGTDAVARVTGGQAMFQDVSTRLSERLPIFIGAVVTLSFLLLMVVFRSVLVPLKAALMNALSIGAAYGVIVAIFQWGWAKDLVGLEETVPINPFVPLIMFAILFGLSMDYEVFLLSRVREAYLRSGDSHASVVEGLGATARVITSAALIMISVFLAFVGSEEVILEMFGVGLATAVLLDATVVRMVLVPATMALLGNANWWLPGWLDRVLPHMDLEAAPEAEVPEVQVPEVGAPVAPEVEVPEPVALPARAGAPEGEAA